MNKELVILIGCLLTPDDLQRILKNHPKALFLADNPYVCELLESLNSPFLTVEDFVPSETISNAGIKNYPLLDHFFKIFDQTIQSSLENKSVHEVFVPELLERYYYTFKRMIDCVSTAFLLGQTIHEKNSFDIISIYTEHTQQTKYSPHDYNFYESFFVQALKEALSPKKVEIKKLVGRKRFRKDLLKGLAREVRNAFRLLEGLYKLVTLRRSHQPTVLFTARGYDLAFIYSDLKEYRDINIFLFNTSAYPARILKWMLKFLGGKSFLVNKTHLEEEIILPLLKLPLEFPEAMTAILKQAFKTILRASYLQNLLAFQFGKVLAEKCNIKAACSPCIATSNEASFLFGLGSGGARTFHYQHGGGQGYLHKPMFEWFFSQTNYLFCYGEAVKENMKVSERIPVFPVGSPRLEHIRRMVRKEVTSVQKSKSLNLICVPSGPNGYRSYFPEVKKTDLSYYFLWRRLLKSLDKLKNELDDCFSVLIKSDHYLGPNIDYFPRLITRKKYGGIDVVCGKPFINFIQQGDIFIIDGPETTILEVMLTNKPVILYFNGGYELSDHFRKLLEKRVYWVENEAQFIERLQNIILNYDDCVREKSDDSFLDYYLSKPESPSFFHDKFLLGNPT